MLAGQMGCVAVSMRQSALGVSVCQRHQKEELPLVLAQWTGDCRKKETTVDRKVN